MPSPLKSATATDEGPLPVAYVCWFWKVPSPLPKSTLTVLSPLFVTARSAKPSPLKSPTAMPSGVLPTAYVCCGWKVPSPSPKSTLTLPLAKLVMAKSANPSPLKSPTAICKGKKPVAYVCCDWKVPSPLPSSTLTVAARSVELVTARSAMPSPLKSPTATNKGPPPTSYATGGWKLPSRLPSSTLTVPGLKLLQRKLSLQFVMAKSAMPSPLKSPIATPNGALPAGYVCCGWKVDMPGPTSPTLPRFTSVVRSVKLAVPVGPGSPGKPNPNTEAVKSQLLPSGWSVSVVMVGSVPVTVSCWGPDWLAWKRLLALYCAFNSNVP